MKIKISSICILLAGFVMFSCSKDDEVYSCNPKANEWVIENKEEISNMTRSAWHNIGNPTLQRAAFVSFSAEKKQLFWIKKLEECLLLDWNVKERKHISKMLTFVSNGNIFKTGINDEGNIFIYKWIEYARTELNWADYTIGSIIMDGHQVVDTKGKLKIQTRSVSNLRSSSEGDGDGKSCDCHVGNYVWTTCGSTADGDPNRDERSCVDNKCSATDGCGFLWSERCDGECR